MDEQTKKLLDIVHGVNQAMRDEQSMSRSQNAAIAQVWSDTMVNNKEQSDSSISNK